MLKQAQRVFFALLLIALSHPYTLPEAAATTVEERLAELEKANAELYHTLEEKKAAGLAEQLAERLSLSGLLEVEAAGERISFDKADSDSVSDLALATAWLSLAAQVTEGVGADLSFLYEEGATDLEVDEAAITVARGPWSVRIGQQYLPFGVFYSHFISDPLTLALGETRDTALLAGCGGDLFSLSAFLFNGRADKNVGEDHIEDWGASLELTPAEGLSLGGSYLSDLADSDADLLGGNPWQRRVAGWSAFVIWESGPWSLSGEYLGAVRSFDPADGGIQPRTWNLEAGWDLRANVEVALRLEGSREFPEQPARQYGIDISWSPWERVSLSLEYLRGEFDADFAPQTEDGRIGNTRDLVTAQLAMEF